MLAASSCIFEIRQTYNIGGVFSRPAFFFAFLCCASSGNVEWFCQLIRKERGEKCSQSDDQQRMIVFSSKVQDALQAKI